MPHTKSKLTAPTVSALPPSPAGVTFHRDTELPGFGVRCSGNTKAYFCEGRPKGRARAVRVTLGRCDRITLTEARQIARERFADMARGIDPNQRDRAERERKPAPTLVTALADYLEARQSGDRPLKASTRGEYDDDFARMFGDWLPRPVTGITRDMVESRYQQLCNRPLLDGRGRQRKRAGKVVRGGVASASRAMRALRAVLSFTVEKYRNAEGQPMLASNPVNVLRGLKLWRSAGTRKGHVPRDKLRALLDALYPTGDLHRDAVRDLLLMCLFTGCRRNEGASLKWADVDLVQAVATFRDTKNRRDHGIPLVPTLVDMLKRRRALDLKGKYVFPADTEQGYVRNIDKALKPIRAAVGFPLSPHDLRRTLVTIGLEHLDMDRPALARIVNHSTGGNITERYAVRSVDAARRRLLTIEDFVLKEAGRRPSATIHAPDFGRQEEAAA